MAAKERYCGEYEYTIVVESITPPLLNGDRYEAKVGEMIDRRRRSTARVPTVPIGAYGRTSDEAIKKVEQRVETWVANRKSK